MTENKTLHIDSLVIETTRRCNMQCDHCLRGDAEDIDIDVCHVITLFKQIDSIGCLTLSGGEPSLVPDVMRWIREVAHIAKVDVQNFYISTNGKDVPDAFVYEVVKWYGQCTDNEISQIKISNDNYHEGDIEYNPVLKLLKITSIDEYEYDDRSLINEGNATLNTHAMRHKMEESFEVEVDGDDIRISEGDLYINVYGNIIGGCDWSYQSQEEHIIGAVDELNLIAWALNEARKNEN